MLALDAGAVSGGVRTTLRLEAVVALIIAVALYRDTSGTWGRFALLFLSPDLAMLGYLAGARVGAAAYNVAHSYVGALALGAVGYTVLPSVLPLALIWAAHIAFDRMIGYGLKYADRFGHTHLGSVGSSPGPR
ncbi:DUF4260 domain-containing protein [Gemmatimonas groenlandica]|uniref:DUF4260 domain-containing protein n=1 Tax=Gemmatimonas groenlandica TaxID=2732249 RepID=A0A6M4IXR7_9BACT|nr:DUF4260 domain-containing protein [Gemmatimonas groenlandica]QJR37692.1 DUF4260 domain-containing protein [Gemmatimonas groenlandica]